MSFSIAEIAASLGAEAVGDTAIVVARAAEPAAAGPEDLALAMSPAYGEGLKAGQARAAVLWPGADWQALGLEAAIFVPRARVAMAGITRALDAGPEIAPGVHPSAVIDPSAQIGAGAAIGPFVHIGPRARIGARARIAAHASVAEDAVIGEDALLCQGVRIGSRVRIGARFIAQPGAVIGGDGFSFVTPEESGVERTRKTLGDQGEIKAQSWTRIHSLGAVHIGDDVEIGANACIDKGTIADTTVGHRTKIDNLVHIGHNNQIGEDCLICGLVGMAGSSRIGNRVVLAGQCGVNDNITVGDDVVAGGASKIFTNVPAGRVILGYPAVKMDSHVEIYKATRRLPRIAAQVAELRKAVAKLTGSD
jgi:UDP-3-O-[3-hydroxymyristoyl] glucosamine N-acyltransferase